MTVIVRPRRRLRAAFCMLLAAVLAFFVLPPVAARGAQTPPLQAPKNTAGAASATGYAAELIRLHTLAQGYIGTEPGDFSDRHIDIDPAAWLAMAYIRSLDANYNGALWNQSAGSIQSDQTAPGGHGFISYVQANGADTAAYFASAHTVDGIDVRHMAATMTSLLYSATGASPVLGAVMTEQQYDDLSGWAGDLQTFVLYITALQPTGTVQDYRGLAAAYMGQASTPYNAADLAADADAVNLYDLLCLGMPFADAVTLYYQSDVAYRYTLFGRHVSAEQALAYTSQTYNVPLLGPQTWPLYADATVTPEQSEGIALGFMDYLAALA